MGASSAVLRTDVHAPSSRPSSSLVSWSEGVSPMSHAKLLDVVAECLQDFSPLELVGLLVLARNELHARNYREAAHLVEQGARSFAADVVGPIGPSDNGATAPGEEGADAEQP